MTSKKADQDNKSMREAISELASLLKTYPDISKKDREYLHKRLDYIIDRLK